MKKHPEIAKKYDKKVRQRKWKMCSTALTEYKKSRYSKEYIREYGRKRQAELVQRKINKVEQIMGKEYYITKDLENFLKVSREYIRQLRNANKIIFTKIEHTFYYPRSFMVN